MTNAQRRVWILGAGLLVAAGSLSAQVTVSGKTRAGAYYRFEVPQNWNKKLVLFNHGWEIDAPQPVTFMGPEPLPQHQLASGYAIAASSYRLNGYAVFSTRLDLQEMMRAFTKRFGKPQEILIYGESMGGLISLEALEVGKLGPVTGVLSLCGMAAGGVPNATHILDLRLIYDVVCGEVPGASILGGAFGLPAGLPFTEEQLGTAVDECTGIFRGPGRTAEQAERLRRILDETTIPEDTLVPDMWFATVAIRDMALDPRKLNGKAALGNLGVGYRDPAINQLIARVKENKLAAKRLRSFYTPTGKANGAKILALHFEHDGLLFVENLNEYAKRSKPADFTPVVVREEQGPTHCQFAPAERLAAWDSLLGWLADKTQPSALDVQVRCEDLVQQGAAGPCRIDPDYQIGNLYDRVKAR